MSRSRDVSRTIEWVERNTRDEASDYEPEEIGGRIEELSIAGNTERTHHTGVTRRTRFLGRFWDEVTNKGLHPDDTTQWLRQLERGSDFDERLLKSYQKAKITIVDFEAPKPSVGLIFLPGADKPTVTRLEEKGMVEKKPYQQTYTWRVNTAGQLLSSRTVDKDLSLINKNQTRKVLDRMEGRLGRDIEDERDTVTIDSEEVRLVDNLRDENRQLRYDLNATLIEVDASSLVKLIMHFRYLVKQSTPHMVPAYHVTHLEDMMEVARFFYARCPILFRMGTRNHIINANDIRYGINDEQGFSTIYPSEGIQELLSVSAAYFNALDTNGTTVQDRSQASVRPRFLQMLVLLLSMLGDSNLRSLATFLKETYGILPYRTDLELLFLKTIPLSSINSKVFLSSLIPAVFGSQVDPELLAKEKVCWENLCQQLARRGYLIPSTLDELGHQKQSWAPAWPKEGIQSTAVFGRLQYHGEQLKGFNEILPIKIGADADVTEVTVYLYNYEQPFIVDVVDYEHIQCLKPGKYFIREAATEGKESSLHIRHEPLNENANRAIRLINNALHNINSQMRMLPNRRLGFFSGKRHEPNPILIAQDLPATAVITRHEVWLEGERNYLAVAWQCDGKTISKNDMLHRMSRSANRIRAVVNHFERLTHGNFGRHNTHYQNVQFLLAQHENPISLERNTNRNGGRTTPDTPIRRTVYPADGSLGVDPTIWYDYDIQLDLQIRPMLLFIFSQRDKVSNVSWMRDGTQAEVELDTISSKFIVAPLKPDKDASLEALNEEIQPGDIVLLCGRYLVVLMATERTPPLLWEDQVTYEMSNWLEIQNVSSAVRRRRRQNQSQVEKVLSVIV